MKVSWCVRCTFLVLLTVMVVSGSPRSNRYKVYRACRGPKCRAMTTLHLKEMQFYKKSPVSPVLPPRPRPTRLRTKINPQHLGHQESFPQGPIHAQEPLPTPLPLGPTTSLPSLPPLTDIPPLDLFTVEEERNPFPMAHPEPITDYDMSEYGEETDMYVEPKFHLLEESEADYDYGSSHPNDYFDPEPALGRPAVKPLDHIRASILGMSLFTKNSDETRSVDSGSDLVRSPVFDPIMKPMKKPAEAGVAEMEGPESLKDAMDYFDAVSSHMSSQLPTMDEKPLEPMPPMKPMGPMGPMKPMKPMVDVGMSKPPPHQSEMQPSPPAPPPTQDDGKPAPGFEEAQNDDYKLPGVMKWYYDNMPTELMSNAEIDQKKKPAEEMVPVNEAKPSVSDDKPSSKPTTRPMYTYQSHVMPMEPSPEPLPLSMEPGPPPPAEDDPAGVQEPVMNTADPQGMMNNDIFPSGFSHLFSQPSPAPEPPISNDMNPQTLSDFAPSQGESCPAQCMCVCPEPANPWANLGSGFAPPSAPADSGGESADPPKRKVNMNISMYPCARSAAYNLSLGLRLCKRSL